MEADKTSLGFDFSLEIILGSASMTFDVSQSGANQ